MEINEFKKRLKDGTVSGAYLFCGEEDYLKKFYLGLLKDTVVLDESLSPFNHIVYDGEKLDFGALTDAIKSPPMMSDYKLVEWRYPNFESLNEAELDMLEELLKLRDEYSYTVLAFITSMDGVDLGIGKKKSSFVTRFEKNLCFLRLDTSTDAQLIQWIKRHFDSLGVKYTNDTPEALVFRSGHSMQVLKNEIDKLSAFAKAREKSLTPSDVELVATSIEECDTFAFSNAVLAHDKAGAFSALADMKAKRIDATIILGMTSRVLTDLVSVSNLAEEGLNFDNIAKTLSMNDYKLRLYLASAKKLGNKRAVAMLSELSRIDVSSKFGGIGGYTAIELFVAQNL